MCLEEPLGRMHTGEHLPHLYGRHADTQIRIVIKHEIWHACYLQACQVYFEDIHSRLTTRSSNLEDVKAMMASLGEVREKEATIDDIVGPVEDIYSMLARYEARNAHQCNIKIAM